MSYQTPNLPQNKEDSKLFRRREREQINHKR